MDCFASLWSHLNDRTTASPLYSILGRAPTEEERELARRLMAWLDTQVGRSFVSVSMCRASSSFAQSGEMSVDSILKLIGGLGEDQAKAVGLDVEKLCGLAAQLDILSKHMSALTATASQEVERVTALLSK